MKRRAGRKRSLPPAASRKLENELSTQGYNVIAGVDEAGCGALAGPVVAAAVVLPATIRINHLTDSKLLPPDERLKLFYKIQQSATCWSVALCPPEVIDSINIYQARLLAMKRAVKGLTSMPDFLLIDGPAAPTVSMPCRTIIGGDRKCRAISASSIMAKVIRDNIMVQLDALYPQYGFARHKGYGTANHMQAIAEHGASPVHRLSFAPVLLHYIS